MAKISREGCSNALIVFFLLTQVLLISTSVALVFIIQKIQQSDLTTGILVWGVLSLAGLIFTATGSGTMYISRRAHEKEHLERLEIREQGWKYEAGRIKEDSDRIKDTLQKLTSVGNGQGEKKEEENSINWGRTRGILKRSVGFEQLAEEPTKETSVYQRPFSPDFVDHTSLLVGTGSSRRISSSSNLQSGVQSVHSVPLHQDMPAPFRIHRRQTVIETPSSENEEALRQFQELFRSIRDPDYRPYPSIQPGHVIARTMSAPPYRLHSSEKLSSLSASRQSSQINIHDELEAYLSGALKYDGYSSVSPSLNKASAYAVSLSSKHSRRHVLRHSLSQYSQPSDPAFHREVQPHSHEVTEQLSIESEISSLSDANFIDIHATIQEEDHISDEESRVGPSVRSAGDLASDIHFHSTQMLRSSGGSIFGDHLEEQQRHGVEKVQDWLLGLQPGASPPS